jgi:hypothetical protein
MYSLHVTTITCDLHVSTSITTDSQQFLTHVLITILIKNKYCYIHIITQTLVPYHIMDYLTLGDRLAVTNSNHFQILQASVRTNTFTNCINYNIKVAL